MEHQINHLKSGHIHKLTPAMQEGLYSDDTLAENWNKLTELARNEWICWVTIAKRDATQNKRLQRLFEEVKNGKKRPCCWPGCPHHNPKAQRFFK